MTVGFSNVDVLLSLKEKCWWSGKKVCLDSAYEGEEGGAWGQ